MNSLLLDSTLASAERELREQVDGDVRFDPGTRAAYSTDASNFRQVPIAVVTPRTVEAAAMAVAVCQRHGLPIVSRGGGTSLAGQCCNEAVVIDFSRHCNRLLSVDPGARTCVVEPGIVLDDLNRQLAPTGLRYGPEPATHPNCTLGGMIGNNSCGATAQRTGKVVDNIVSLDVLLHDGTRFTARRLDDEQYTAVVTGVTGVTGAGQRVAEIHRELRRIREEHADLIRERYPDIPRRVSGYNLDSLLPEHGFDIAGFLVGSEATLVTVLRAELKLVPVVTARTLVVLGYDDIASAADAVPAVVEHQPIALEGIDHYLLHDQRLKGMNIDALDQLPEGRGFLMVQFGGEDQDEADNRAHAMLDAIDRGPEDADVSFYDDPAVEDEFWLVRESGLGATAHVPHKPDTFEGWEDSAVPVHRLGDYLRDLRDLYEEFGYASDTGPSLYGHFGQGCVHTRIPFDLFTTEGVATYRRFMERAADLCVSYGGSLSGEHGDGQSRGELLKIMFGDQVVGLFEQVKALFDPEDLMNPGKVVHPAALDAHLRLGGTWAPRQTRSLYFDFPQDGHSFIQAADRCVGVGKCRQYSHEGGQVMCPSYQATGEEQHATRGRARLLFEMLNGHGDSPITDGWRSQEVKEALDLCLACKGCKADCPASVDMATYKAEFLAQHYRHRLRPRADYVTGWLPTGVRALDRLHLQPLVNRLAGIRPLRRAGSRLAGLEDRDAPRLAAQTLQAWAAQRARSVRRLRSVDADRTKRGKVMLFPDTFTNYFHPDVGRAAVAVLEDAGWQVEIPIEPLCCGLTWISTGQLDVAKRRLRRTVNALAPHVRSGGLVVGLEPSCTSVFRSDAKELFAADPDVDRLKEHTVTFAELLLHHSDGWQPPRLDGTHGLAQVHCHQHAVLGWDVDRQLLEKTGADVERLDSGCCGLAGNFGFTAGHGAVSEACAEQVLLPRLRQAPHDTITLADGFSCRTQIEQLDSGGKQAQHLAQLLARALDQDHPS
ncbi:FAD-binding and (Fe-S)-binding domain-containing protein [Nocardioides panacisoli]|uniref:FAD-binding and (Fe-S)-binding domain-containing protein n=1 Tax=Nocardioides panacisoli TaxID=627624 RepID=A0ABP7J7C6_9ACTN